MAENELQILINGIFSRIKEEYGYTDEQALIYLKGYEGCAKEHQQSLEKRDKMLRDTVEELCEAKRLLKLAVEDLEELHSEADYSCNCCKGEKAESCQFIKCWTWRYADEVEKLLKEE